MVRIDFYLNYEAVSIEADMMKRLIDMIRDDFGLTGTKEGCSEGECGACSVLIDGRLMNSCIVTASYIEGRSVVTIEGYKNTKRFELLKRCFESAGSVQCGFCTPGMILACEALLSQDPHPDRDRIKRFLSGNLCRCTGYEMIVDAVEMAAEEGDGLW